MSGPGPSQQMNIFARIRIRGAASGYAKTTQIKQSAEDANKELSRVQKKLSDNKIELAGLGINMASLLQTTRFLGADMTKLMAGEGSLGNVLNVAISTIIMLYRIYDLQQRAIERQAVLTALGGASSVGLAARLPAMMGGPVGIALAVAGTVWGVLEMRNQMAKTEDKEGAKKMNLDWGTISG